MGIRRNVNADAQRIMSFVSRFRSFSALLRISAILGKQSGRNLSSSWVPPWSRNFSSVRDLFHPDHPRGWYVAFRFGARREILSDTPTSQRVHHASCAQREVTWCPQLLHHQARRNLSSSRGGIFPRRGRKRIVCKPKIDFRRAKRQLQ